MTVTSVSSSQPMVTKRGSQYGNRSSSKVYVRPSNTRGASTKSNSCSARCSCVSSRPTCTASIVYTIRIFVNCGRRAGLLLHFGAFRVEEAFAATREGITHHPALAQFAQLFQRELHLAQDLKNEWWSDFFSAMQRNGYAAAIGMLPAFMTAGLSGAKKTKFSGGILQVARGGARHSQLPWYLSGARALFRDALQRSC